MKVFKVVLKVIAGVAFWGYIFALLFIEDTYHPFMKKDADIAAKTVVEKTKPARTQVRTQVRPQAPAVPTGISVYTSTDSESSPSQQLYFSGVATKAEATKSAAAKCRNSIAGHENYLKCKEVTFFTQGCFARYRIGSGQASNFGPTEEEAQVKAKQQCDMIDGKNAYSCVLDTNKCIAGGNNQGTRNWQYHAIGITETYYTRKNTKSVNAELAVGTSRAEAKNTMDDYCVSISGKSCRKIYTISGDQCLAVAISAAGNYSVRSGEKKRENSLIATVKQNCRGAMGRNCGTKFYCAE